MQIEEAVSNSSTHITNTKKAANHLCSNRLNHVMENCLDTAPMGVGVIDFYTNEIRLLDKKFLGFSFGDYYISCNGWNDNNEWQEINLLVFYCPER